MSGAIYGAAVSSTTDPDRAELLAIAAGSGVDVRSAETDATGWRWRCAWRGVEIGAWNDMDGVAVVADIGPWDEWVGLRGHPADPAPSQALRWALEALEPWLAEPANAARVAARRHVTAAGSRSGSEQPDPVEDSES